MDNDTDFATYLLEQAGVALVPGSAFGMPGCLRLSFATSIETLRQMVAADVGITLMPELAITSRRGPVRYLPFRGEHPHRDIGLCWRASSTRGRLIQEMGQVLQDVMKEVMSEVTKQARKPVSKRVSG